MAQYFSSAKRKELSIQIPHSVKMSFRNEEELKTFSDEGKLIRVFVANRPTPKKLQRKFSKQKGNDEPRKNKTIG